MGGGGEVGNFFLLSVGSGAMVVRYGFDRWGGWASGVFDGGVRDGIREREGWWKKRAAYYQGILTASLSILSTITPKL